MKYIIGSGITAMIAKKIFPEYKIIAPKKSSLPELFYLWDTEYTRKFCEENNYGYKEKEITIKQYGENINAYNKVTYKPIENKPCEGKKSFNSLETKIELPEPEIKNTVREVTEDSIIMDGVRKKYEHLIWTAHLDKTVFFNKKYDVKYYPISYLITKTKDFFFEEDFAYFYDTETLNRGLYRASKQDYGYCFEYSRFLQEQNKSMEKYWISKFLLKGKINSAKIIVNPRGFVQAKEKPVSSEKIFYVGRYSECDHEIKSSDVIKKLMRYKNEK